MAPSRSSLLSVFTGSILIVNSFAHEVRPHHPRFVDLNARQATGPSFTLHSTNPTAIPLQSIDPSETTKATEPLKATPTPGSVPSGLTGAPGLPNVSGFDPSKYPTPDKVPPTDSPEVKAWIQEVANSGIAVPGINPTNGSCPIGITDSTDPTCWWTCTGCTRNTDISFCPTKNTWGLTYDDGPGFYTPNLLDYLSEQSLKATFFVVGSRCAQFPATLQAEYLAGHQISVHTWSHPSLTTLTTEQVIAELGWSRQVIKDVLGVTPNMMRPPFGDIDDRIRNISIAMGLTPVMWTRGPDGSSFDTTDFDLHSSSTPNEVMGNWTKVINTASNLDTGFIVLEHDLFEQTVEVATGYILPDALARQIDIKPVITCMNKPMTDAYVELNDNSTNPAPGTSGSNSAGTSGSGGNSTTSTSGGAKGSGSGALSLQWSGDVVTPLLLAAIASFMGMVL